MPHRFRLGHRDERVNREEAGYFMLEGEPGDLLLAVDDRIAGIWLDTDVLVTRIHPSSSVGFGLLENQRKNIVWINLDYDDPIPTASEVRLIAALRGLQA